jgi:hypothetical protein
MTHTATRLAWLGALALIAGNALGSSPDTDSRARLLGAASGAHAICEGGTTPGAACSNSAPCGGTGTCTGLSNVRIAARGVLTIISDTKPPGVSWSSSGLPVGVTCTNPSLGNVGSCERRDNSLFTLMLEFTLNGKSYTFASTYPRLPDNLPCPDDPIPSDACPAQIPDWDPGNGQLESGWFQSAVESVIAERVSGPSLPVAVRWGGLPPAAEAAVGAVLGKTATQRVALSRSDEVPICTDTTPCHLSATNPRFSDHSQGNDLLATVRRYKVDIAVIGP